MAESEITQTTSDLRTLVEVKDLKTHFFLHEGVVRAVDGVSFNIYEGHSLGVIGESGCGKSVTAQSMMRIAPTPPGREVAGTIQMFSSAKMAGKAWKSLSVGAEGRR